MPRYWVALDNGFIVDADSVEKTDDGRLIFYIDDIPVAELPAETWLGYGTKEEEVYD